MPNCDDTFQTQCEEVHVLMKVDLFDLCSQRSQAHGRRRIGPPHRHERYVWVKVKGSARAIKITTTELHDVDALLKAVKNEEKQKLGGVDSGDLQLFECEEANLQCAEMIRPSLSLTDLNGGDNDDKPLYVFYPDMNPDSTALQARSE